jgi:hypothetical protein
VIGARLVILLATFACTAVPPAWSDELTEMPVSFPVTIGADMFRLEGLVIKKSDAQGRLPIAVLTNGGGATATAGAAATSATYAHYARDLARRGWLAVVTIRHGFGQSEGPKPTPITCQAASLGAWATAAADDLQATIDNVSKRPDADASKVIVIGSRARKRSRGRPASRMHSTGPRSLSTTRASSLWMPASKKASIAPSSWKMIAAGPDRSERRRAFQRLDGSFLLLAGEPVPGHAH